MNEFESLIAVLDYSLNSRRRRHIAGGILMSLSLLFGGLAFTVMTMKEDEESDE